MPLVEINLIKGWTSAQKTMISDAIHSCLVEAWTILDDDRNHRIHEFERSNFLRPPDKTDKYVLIQITAFPGRSADAKGRLYRLIVDRLAPIGIPASDVLIVLNEPPMTNWGIRGGKPATDVDLGYEVEV